MKNHWWQITFQNRGSADLYMVFHKLVTNIEFIENGDKEVLFFVQVPQALSDADSTFHATNVPKYELCHILQIFFVTEAEFV